MHENLNGANKYSIMNDVFLTQSDHDNFLTTVRRKKQAFEPMQELYKAYDLELLPGSAKVIGSLNESITTEKKI